MIIILCPLRKELEALQQALEKQSKSSATNEAKTTYCLAQGGRGKIEFALSTQEQIVRQKNSPITLVICAGTAGALAPQVSPGDVVIGTSTIEHDFYSLYKKDLNLPTQTISYPTFPSRAVLTSPLPSPTNYKIFKGPIASGDEDIFSSERAQEIYQETQALAVAWEGAGGARACRKYKIPFLEIRGITDLANSTSLKDFQTHLNSAMERVAHTLISYL